MHLRDYLEARIEAGTLESIADFARTIGENESTIYALVSGRAMQPRAGLAHKIIKASRREPAPNGGTVTLEALGEGG